MTRSRLHVMSGFKVIEGNLPLFDCCYLNFNILTSIIIIGQDGPTITSVNIQATLQDVSCEVAVAGENILSQSNHTNV